jgi:hypothetical protein
MIPEDPIVEEVRRVRQAHAASFKYDLGAIVEDLKAQERASGKTYVSYPPLKAARAESPSTQPTRARKRRAGA